jgi:hypothetical protein
MLALHAWYMSVLAPLQLRVSPSFAQIFLLDPDWFSSIRKAIIGDSWKKAKIELPIIFVELA